MKKIITTSILFLTLAVPIKTSAADKIITVDWTIPTALIDDIQNYVLSYSPNSDMSGATPQTCDQFQQTGVTEDQTSFSMTCTNVPIIPGQYAYFTLDAVGSEATTTSEIFSKDTKLSTVINFQTLTPGANISPTAVITASTTTGVAPLTVNFDASGSSDPEESALSYSWSFGDDSPVDTGKSPSHTFTTVGSFEVSLVVTDDKGAKSETAFTTVSASEAPAGPAYSFYWSAESDYADFPPDKPAKFTGNGARTQESAFTGLMGFDIADLVYSNATFSIINNDIADPRQGSASIWLNVQQWNADRRIMLIKSTQDGADNIQIVLGSTGRIFARARMDGTNFDTTAITTTASGTGEWFQAIVRWDLNNHSLTLESNGLTATHNSINGNWGNIPTEVNVGIGDTYGFDAYVDDFKIFKNPLEVIQ